MAKILIVDDEAALRSVLRRSLQREGHETFEAAHGRDALKILKQIEGIQLVITDIVMPEMEGIDLIFSLRQTHRNLPVIAMSGGGRNGSSDYLKIALVGGAVKALAKPFEIGEMLQAIATLLSPIPIAEKNQI